MDHAGLIFDLSPQYVDHLAPFCASLGWPLIACEESIAQLARRYYPDLHVVEADPLKLSLPPRLVACDSRPFLQAAFPQTRFRDLLWLPHGNSDKGWKSPFFEALEGETACVYGQKMVDFIRKKTNSAKLLRIGNFRWRYFLKHRAFYQKTAQEEIGARLPSGNRNFLYAPTWEDAEGNGTFWKAFPLLANTLPPDCNLLVKLHPNTRRRFEIQIEALLGRYEKKANIFFLPEFPPVYALLSLCDAYIGDMSSIGYDFLRFDRPMFFIDCNGKDAQADPSLFLRQCGTALSLEQMHEIFHTQEPADRSAVRKQVYDYTFDAAPEGLSTQQKLHG